MQVRRLVVLAGIAMSPSAARAEDDNSLFVAGGPLLGAGIHDGPNGLLVGGELSAGWFHMGTQETAKPFWLGAYGDALYDTGTETGRVSIGPELATSSSGSTAAWPTRPAARTDGAFQVAFRSRLRCGGSRETIIRD